ncbi:hypothetical protein OQA88_8504 [Cercophora sp. LCS_1]
MPDSSDKTRLYGLKGPRSLVTICILKLALNLSMEADLDDLVSRIPPRLVSRVWANLRHHNCVNLPVWKAFAKHFQDPTNSKTNGKERDLTLVRFESEIDDPQFELDWYLKQLASPAMSVHGRDGLQFLAFLRIDCVSTFESNHLLALSDMRNLTSLEIVEEQYNELSCKVTDRLVRSWSEKIDPFPALRTLKFIGAYKITGNAMQYICKFPSLHIYDVSPSANDACAAARKYGWWSLQRPGHNARELMDTFALYMAYLLETNMRISEPNASELSPGDAFMHFMGAYDQGWLPEAKQLERAPGKLRYPLPTTPYMHLTLVGERARERKLFYACETHTKLRHVFFRLSTKLPARAPSPGRRQPQKRPNQEAPQGPRPGKRRNAGDILAGMGY